MDRKNRCDAAIPKFQRGSDQCDGQDDHAIQVKEVFCIGSGGIGLFRQCQCGVCEQPYAPPTVRIPHEPLFANGGFPSGSAKSLDRN